MHKSLNILLRAAELLLGGTPDPFTGRRLAPELKTQSSTGVKAPERKSKSLPRDRHHSNLMLVGWGTTGRTDAVPPQTQRGGIGGERTGSEAPRKETAEDGQREPVGVGTGENNPREEGRQQMKQGAPPHQPSHAVVMGDAVQTGPAAPRVNQEGRTGGTQEDGPERPANTSTGEQTPTERGCRRVGSEKRGPAWPHASSSMLSRWEGHRRGPFKGKRPCRATL